ncbi:hypothetical protein SSS_07596 [Sarcoptes scabiei]|nr:hypothetical protein SSS_07596 [Sarcoptes scabiei]
MAEKIDMSLDEIIKRDKISVGRGRRRGGKFSAGVSKFRTRKTNVRKIGATSRQMKSGVSVKRGKAGRKLPDKWAHDKFIGSDIKSATLMISNLDFGVSDQDIRELFSEFGPLKKAAVHYDSSGRSLGKAEVIFFKVADSIRALKKYNGVTLDGRPMSIQSVVNTPTKSTIASRIGSLNAFKTTIKPKANRGQLRARRGRRGNAGNRGGLSRTEESSNSRRIGCRSRCLH